MVKDMPAVNEAKVAALSAAIENGTYKVSADKVADNLMQIEQAHGICHGGPASPHFLRDLFLPHSEFSRQTRIRLRLLDRVQIRALQILD